MLKATSLIGFTRGGINAPAFTAFDPQTGAALEPSYSSATLAELDTACRLAEQTRIVYGKVSGGEKAVFLRRIAENIESLGDKLLERAHLETGLALERLATERARTCFTLRMFAELVARGDWVDARLDTPDQQRKPLPKPDVRSMLRPLGTVAVFCASNFPLAYSVAGGDTASALAAGCPVIVNAHSAHPGTAELVGECIVEAVKKCGLPEGTFSLLLAQGYEIGQALVRHPHVKAVGFTGSRSGGRALMDIAAKRPEPIPVYAEMSSINPVFILPSAMQNDSAKIITGLHNSVTAGAGQFCTKPGVVFLPEAVETAHFISSFGQLMQQTPPHPLLTEGIRDNFVRSSDSRHLPKDSAENDLRGYEVNPSLFQTGAQDFINDKSLEAEIFGPTTLFVRSNSREELVEIARALEGQLTATIWGTPEELNEYADLIEILQTKVGRLIFNGYPTGVEVGDAIVHGGAYPATSDGRTSAVGTRAIRRFCRFVCWQNFPNEALPEELKDENPLSIKRLIDGEFRD